MKKSRVSVACIPADAATLVKPLSHAFRRSVVGLVIAPVSNRESRPQFAVLKNTKAKRVGHLAISAINASSGCGLVAGELLIVSRFGASHEPEPERDSPVAGAKTADNDN